MLVKAASTQHHAWFDLNDQPHALHTSYLGPVKFTDSWSKLAAFHQWRV